MMSKRVMDGSELRAVARVAVEQALRREDAADLVPRIAVVANPIDPAFSTGSVPANRERLVVAVGRRDLKIKDAGLLRAALDRFLAARRDYRAVVVGRGQGTRFRNHGSGRLASAGADGTVRLWTAAETAGELEQRRRVWRDQQARDAETAGRWFAAAFLLFRVFDILKPWPIWTIERRVGGGLGVMLDDVVAAIYALLLMLIAEGVFGVRP